MIIKPKDKFKEFKGLRTGGLQKKGLSTGFADLDENIKLAKGYMAIVTGVPSSGKSEFLDAILVNMSIDHGWKTMYYSPENHPIEQHMSKIAEKYIGKHITAFTELDINKAMEYMDSRFSWIYPENPKLEVLLDLANEEATSNGLDCFVIDPWNAVTHSHNGQMIHEYLATALGKVIRFTRDNSVLACIVAHPTKPQADKNGCYPVPDLYSISDGAMWRNRADYGMVVHRPDMSKNSVEVYIGKVKYKWMGKVGMKEFDYNYQNGRFKGKDEKEFVISGEIGYAF